MDAAEQQDYLRSEITRLLDAALAADNMHLGETERRDKLHLGEMERRDVLHIDETSRRQDAFDHQIETIRVALETRDIIGQAKGIIISSMGCSSDDAFILLRAQSQTENRKLVEVAAEVVATSQRRHRDAAERI